MKNSFLVRYGQWFAAAGGGLLLIGVIVFTATRGLMRRFKRKVLKKKEIGA